MVAELLDPPVEMGTSYWSYRLVLKRDPCFGCGARQPGRRAARRYATIDHVHPRSLGGGDELENLAGSCWRCNTRKGSRSLLAFLLERLDRADGHLAG